uniref:BED-type domain-containing protein n=1 Tax=Populus alba TaxID=43335 RepID=A0A4U5MND1_POPAL|nr:uncharacterized protein D5086_0000305330 [Populus alba]
MDSINSFKGYGKVDEAEQQAFRKKSQKRLIIIVVSSIVLLAVIIGAVIGVVVHKRNNKSSSDPVPPPELTPATSLKAVCSVTQYPASCFSSISALEMGNTTYSAVLFKLSLRVAMNDLSKLKDYPNKLIQSINDTILQDALKVCSTVFDDVVDRLNDSISSMVVGEGEQILSPAKMNDLKTWLMVREKDVCWEYAEKLDGNKVKCKFCLRVLNGGISRLKHHLSRLPSKGVNPCSKVRDDVSDRVRAIIASKDDVKETGNAKKQKVVEGKSTVNVTSSRSLLTVEATAPTPVVAKVYPTVMPMPMAVPPLSSQENAEKNIALFFFENKLDFSVARSPSYQLMVDAIGKCGAGFTGPSADMLRTTWLERIKSEFTGGQELIKTGITKPVSNFLSLQSMLKQRSRLKQMLNSPEFSMNSSYANNPKNIACIAIIEDGDFWRAVEESVAISEPFLKVMREVSGGKPAVGSIYELMTRAKESIRTYYIMDESKCKTFLDIVDRKWGGQLHSPLHSAAAFLNPSVQYNPEIKFLVSIKEDFFKVIEKLLPTPDMRRDITNQIFIFTRASGMFGCSLAMEARDTVAPGLWWEQFGDSAPVLQRVAIRILSQVCSTFTFEKHWSTFQQIHSEKRNKIDKETLNDLAYINYNLKLTRQMRTKPLEADPIQYDDIDMTSEWVEESDNPSPTQWLDRFGSALDGSDLNTRFNAAIFGANDHLFI